SIRDEEEAVAVDGADVAGVEPAVGAEDLVGGLGLLEVAERRDVRPARQDLAVRCDLELDAGQRLPHGPELVPVRSIEREARAGLGKPVAVEKKNARGVKELGDVARERSAARHGPAQAPAEGGVELREDELVGDLALELERTGHGLAALLMAAHVAS